MNNGINIALVDKLLQHLFPINRSLTGEGVEKSLTYLQKNLLNDSVIKSIPSGEKVFDWEIPPQWNVKDAYVKNKNGKKIIDISENNIHLMSYSKPIKTILSKNDFLKKLHTLPDHPEWIPYRTSYYRRDWGFCCRHNLLKSKDFVEPFEINIDSELKENGKLIWLESYKKGKVNQEILISSYCCHPSLANDNLSGFIGAALLFNKLQSVDTKYSYRLVIGPETIGTIAFLSQANLSNVIGGMILSCVAGPDKLSIKEGFDPEHWINKAAHYALKQKTNNDYITYPFVPDGSDERQYSSPGIRIVTPSIHKSKYYEYDEYHTSADNLDFISSKDLIETLEIYLQWVDNIESYCFPKRLMKNCEYQLGKRSLYPNTGGTISQPTHEENSKGSHSRQFDFNNEIQINGKHLDVFSWLMHLADGKHSNFEIASISNCDLKIVNESISLFLEKDLIKI